ncbi:DNA-directed RNA polymerase III subunit RPC3-like [Liolophura sinensis]|uniref:DNA-directed RNA polymerase III subunit RPC3-like n=1 Tax=Liolophura sinensis TaxID=3198878 RepID=UPI0031591092
MSKNKNILCSLILKENYGEITEKVCLFLMKYGASALGQIVQGTQFQKNLVKKALATMSKHSIVTFKRHKKGFFEYSVNTDAVLHRLRYHRYIYCAKLLFGDAAELIVEEVLQQGQVLMTTVIQKVTIKLNEALESSGHPSIGEEISKEKFASLVKTHFLMRCPDVLTDDNGVVTGLSTVTSEEVFILPPEEGKKRKFSDGHGGQPTKKLKTSSGAAVEVPSDDGVYWMVNFDRFHQYFRDQSFIQAVENKNDKRAAEIVRAILRVSELKTNQWASVTSPISLNEIYQVLPKELGLTKHMTEQYLSVLGDDTAQFVSRVGDSGGGMFVVNIQKALTTLTKLHIESVIHERYGSKTLRIFRVLLLKKHLEQKQIEEFAMIPAKEAKELLYTLFSAGYVNHTELSKTPDHAPSRTFYLFTVEISSVARMILEKCYKGVTNAILRREYEMTENKRLLDKQQRVEAIAASLEQSEADPSQKEEIEEMISPPERAQIAKVKTMINKLDQAELQLDETIFVIQMYLHYLTLDSLNK